jgi:hypothetical protein
VTSREDGEPSRAPAPADAAAPSPSADAVRILFAYSSNREEMTATLIPRFNAAPVQVDGRPVHVKGADRR